MWKKASVELSKHLNSHCHCLDLNVFDVLISASQHQPSPSTAPLLTKMVNAGNF